jgi:hypothetical protein
LFDDLSGRHSFHFGMAKDAGRPVWEHMNFLNRVGGFFILVGLICLAVFFITDPADGIRSNLGILMIGVVLLLLGVILKVKNRPPAEETTRFESLRRMNQRTREQRAKRLAKQKAKEKQKKG